MSKNDGGPAFPTVARDGNWQPHHDGMTLRDWFAGQALTGFVSSRSATTTFLKLARDAYIQADAMLTERERSK